ncbi:hypothetical protein [Kibdelosporangium philippinense]
MHEVVEVGRDRVRLRLMTELGASTRFKPDAWLNAAAGSDR